MNRSNTTFLVHQKQLHQTQLVESLAPSIGEGEILFEVEKYLFSSNNITYALLGELGKYWDFFPAEAPFGIIPVWGFAKVVASQQTAINIGDRYFGYFPMSRFLKVQVGKMTAQGFVDQSEHRKGLIPIYNNYTNVSQSPIAQTIQEDYSLLTRIAFPTGFLIYHLLRDESFYNAEQLVISSASAKTALSLAYLLHKNRAADGKKIIALTSSRNVDFVQSTGYYDQVLSYSEWEKGIDLAASAVLDFSGNSDLLLQLHEFLKQHLNYTLRIGLTDWSAKKSFEELPNSSLFHARIQGQQNFKEWGPEKTTKAIQKGIVEFTTAANAWLSLSYIDDHDGMLAQYRDLLQGNVDPSKGYIIRNWNN